MTYVDKQEQPLFPLALLSNVLFIAASVLIPDGNDAPGTYAIFGLVSNPSPVYEQLGIATFLAGSAASFLAFIIHYHRNNQY